MLLYLTNYLAQFESGFDVFNYLTLRAILGALTALIISFVVGPRMIAKLSVNQVGQPIRSDGPESHFPKAGTPTMGGALILTAVAVSTVLWADLENHFVWAVLFVMLAFGVSGIVVTLNVLGLVIAASIVRLVPLPLKLSGFAPIMLLVNDNAPLSTLMVPPPGLSTTSNPSVAISFVCNVPPSNDR